MELDEYARIAAVEDDHWWYRNTRAVMGDLLAPWLGAGQTILDAGCGPGGNGAWLGRHGHVTGLDIAPEGLRYVRARRRELAPVQGDVTALPFCDRCFDIAVAVTVVYAVPDDEQAVAELARVLRPGGALLLIEPAFRALRRAHDKTVASVRRYRRPELVALTARAGLSVQRATYAYSFLTPAAAALSLVDRLRPRPVDAAGSDVDRRGVDALFEPMAHLERRWLRHGDVPVGTSVVVVATRPRSGP
ncbi:MAG TPA: class I SAM-dependent methyltransferase [Acidimicrobiia bacterium]|nr:class I SAM-dependent methyltransferase [Acidimicrobiia bacterium]